MLTNTMHNEAPLAISPDAQRRRRHLSVYHRALRSAQTPEQRAAVAARYRQLFSQGPEHQQAEVTVRAAA
jgi:hypothetical protein